MTHIARSSNSTLHQESQGPEKRSPQIFSDSYALCLQVFHYAKTFARPYRPTLGRRLEESSLYLVLNIKSSLFMSTGSEKTKCLEEVSQKLNETRTLFDITRDIGLLTPAAYKELSDLGLRVGKGLGGLLKHHQKQNLQNSAHASEKP